MSSASPFGSGVDAILAEKRWLDEHPEFEVRPATIREFVTAPYLDIEDKVRPGVMALLIDIFGWNIDADWISVKRKAMMTGGIGIGKTTFASIVLPYMVHWVFCLKDPFDHFNLMKDTRIAFMMMSTSEKQAKEVLFGDVKARVDNSPWFRRYCPRDKKYENQLRFGKELHVIPGGSEETRFEGYNIFGGVIDEGDSHKQTPRKDYAEEGYDTIHSRIESRFMDDQAGKFKGILIVIGQTKTATGFMNKMFDEFTEDDDAVAVRMTIWESKGWHNYTEDPQDVKRHKETAPRKSFIYDIMRKEVLHKAEADAMGADYTPGSKTFIEVPVAYLTGFLRNPQKALRDLAGIPPEANDPFIAYTQRIIACQDNWEARNGDRPPVNDSPHDPRFNPWFKATDRLKRVMHIDIGYSDEGDALGMAMGHVPEVVDIEGEEKPMIMIDFLLRIHAAKGTQVVLSDVRKLIYHVKFDLGFNLHRVTMDGFQSTDFRQQLRKAKIQEEYLSIDKKKLPYEDARDAIYDERLLLPRYMTHLSKGDTKTVDIAFRELSQLSDVGLKIDHPPKGSKDVADCIAGVTHYLMNDAQYRRGARRDRYSGVGKEDESPVDLEEFLRTGRINKPGIAEQGEPLSLEEWKVGEPFQGLQMPPKPTALTVDFSNGIPNLGQGFRY